MTVYEVKNGSYFIFSGVKYKRIGYSGSVVNQTAGGLSSVYQCYKVDSGETVFLPNITKVEPCEIKISDLTVGDTFTVFSGEYKILEFCKTPGFALCLRKGDKLPSLFETNFYLKETVN